MAVDDDFDIPDSGAVFTFGKSRFANNAPSKFWIKNDMIIEIACGDEHTAVVTESGRVFMIGSNDMGQLGLGSTKPVNKPSCIKSLKPEKALHIACGRSHTLVSCVSGSVYVWGHNGDGQLGTGDLDDRLSPIQVLKLDIPPVAVVAGSTHSAVLTETGEIYIWGNNSEGQLGLDVGEQLTPALLTIPDPVVNIACGYYHTVAVTASGQAYAWGESDHGKLGLPGSQVPFHRHPQVVPLPEKIVQVAAGSAHTLFLSESGAVYSCGSGNSGELGQGGGELECWVPWQVVETNTRPVVAISCGDNHSSAITDDGYLLTWGCGRHGKLCQGEENFSSQFIPVIVRRLRHIKVVLVGCGGCHTMVLGYRRSEEEETNGEEENSHPLHLSVNSTARARRRITDGILPPLKSVGLPPIKHTVLPTVPDTEGAAQLTGEPQIDAPNSIVVENDVEGVFNGVTENSVSDVESEGEEDNHENKEKLPQREKKGGRLARFFGNLGRKKSSHTIQSPPAITEEPPIIVEEAISDEPSVEEDAHLESIGDPNSDTPEEKMKETVEAFTDSSEKSAASLSDGTPGHKKSRACVIL
ncbi:X-linked retinitis pigmentosa GTPase regulator-like isoform X2 [Panulirus ornatus]|uniref:X-linked retinitis pigmentosa GTPase regulator-like isoform X2 n=1 Tax=Panulirus ornatus TaxID=150431 RepID=UPI003A870739